MSDDPRAEPAEVAPILRESRLLAIIRHSDSSHTARGLRALADGGVRLAEVTTSTPGWLDLIAGADDRLVIGAGTVTSVAQVADAAAAGARFVVSPGLDAEVVAAALDRGLEPFPGVLTATEVTAAISAGARALKLFPAGPLGPGYLRALLGPFAGVRFVPTGGITPDSVLPWLDAGAFAVALGSELAGRGGPATDDEARALAERARQIVTAAAGGQHPDA